MNARAWRSRIAIVLGRLYLLGLADRLLMWIRVLAEYPASRNFARDHPDFPVPPARLLFETAGHVSPAHYRDTGRAHAQFFARLIGEHAPRSSLSVLEWGCGSGRIIRHLKAAGLDPGARVIGVDVDRANIEWCRAHVQGIEFRECAALPPLPLADGTLDVVYHYSVWTHLTQASIEAWVKDMARALRDDGLMIGTSHGDRYRDMLSAAQAAAYGSGHPVEHTGCAEGHKRFLGFHPPEFLEPLLRRYFEDVRRVPTADAPAIPQDVWYAQGCRRR